MHNERTNLLPPDRVRALRWKYASRLVTVIALFIILLTGIAAVLLLPTYVFLTESIGAKEMRLKSMETALASNDDTALSTRLTLLTHNAETLVALAKIPSVSTMMRTVLAVPHPGISLLRATYAPAAQGKPGTLSLSGLAATRDALRSYQLALQTAPFATAADLPVSAYAQDANIAFTIDVTLAP